MPTKKSVVTTKGKTIAKKPSQVKGKPVAKAPAPKVTVITQQQRLDMLPFLAQQQIGWKPAITRYVLDAKELQRYMKDNSFNQQTPMNNPGESPVHHLGGFIVQEVGAYTEVIDPKSGEVKDYRIVKVMEEK